MYGATSVARDGRVASRCRASKTRIWVLGFIQKRFVFVWSRLQHPDPDSNHVPDGVIASEEEAGADGITSDRKEVQERNKKLPSFNLASSHVADERSRFFSALRRSFDVSIAAIVLCASPKNKRPLLRWLLTQKSATFRLFPVYCACAVTSSILSVYI